MRKPRHLSPGATYHVIARANRQEFILRDSQIKDLLLKTIRDCRGRHRFELCSICLMDNHVHMMIRPADGESLSRIMQWILSVFALRYNRRLSITGHVWYDRFRSHLINTRQHLIATFRYIHNNPVRAGLVSDGVSYRHSTVQVMSHGPPGVIVAPADLLNELMESIET